MTPYERLLLPENLYYAWRKAKRLYLIPDGHINQGELLEFELDLENRLQKIRRQFKEGRYKLQPIRPIPRPKKLKDGTYVNRQYYHIAVADQVAWIAIVNALGPELDNKMPTWSYGNRLYRPAWYEGEQRESKLEIGPYRHASGHLYKKFQHSWPLFRKHISLTARKMARSIKQDKESESDQRALEAAYKQELPYLDPKKNFWNRSQNKGTELYYASIDLKQFYPNIQVEKILAGLLPTQNAVDRDGKKLKSLLESMLKFTLDKSDIPAPVLENVEPPFEGKDVRGLPTGLFVAGFLANVAMMSIDELVNKKIRANKTIAHFRFVDDHTILAYEFGKLYKWIECYKNLVTDSLGVEVNEEKIDPESLSKWIEKSNEPSSDPAEKEKEKTLKLAQADCKIDGKNPTKLLTKTLEKVSIIANQDINVLDDHDITNRLKDLEWLLLADIPDREIRSDTRAAFAAGQITMLAPILDQEADGIVDIHRELAGIKRELRSLKICPEANKIQILKHEERAELLTRQEEKLQQEEEENLVRCFSLLIGTMAKHPGKNRIFFRLHQYCLLTGHQGLSKIIEWIEGLRKQRASIWADYYTGLTIQILARNILSALRILTDSSSLRSDQEAAGNHLKDIAGVDRELFKTGGDDKSWFYKTAQREYAVSIAIAAEYLNRSELENLGSNFARIAEFHGAPALKDNSSVWIEKTEYSAGNWAYLAENKLRTNPLSTLPTCLWELYDFDYGITSDRRAIYLYPNRLPEKAWEYFIAAKSRVKEDDSGRIYDILKDKPEWIEGARETRKKAFTRAVHALEAELKTHISAAEWTKYIHGDCCPPFDPRRSEWTALEVIKQVIESYKETGKKFPLKRIHPQNILIPKQWREVENNGLHISWEKWHNHAQKTPDKIKFTEKHSLLDYRYQSYKGYNHGADDDIWLERENQFAAIGRLLLGLLYGSHDAPVEWNIRGNERVLDIPRARMFRSLAISSPTLLLIEGCIGPRSAESRLIIRQPDLFGLSLGLSDIPNDVCYDPPRLENLNDLTEAIKKAQDILVENQLAVSGHEPRQLIPFKIIDFDVSASGESEEDLNA